MRRRQLIALPAGLLPLSVWASSDAADFQTAIVRDNHKAVLTLLVRGVDVNSRDERGRPALVKALQIESMRVAEMLLSAPGIRVNEISPQGETALMQAAIKGHLPVVRRLLAMGADVNLPGWTPLHYAASAALDDSTEIAALLIEHHAYIDAESPNKSTPLMLAAQYGSEATVDLLLNAGADAQLKNQQGLTAVDFARRSDRDFMVAKMQQALSASRPARGKW